MSRARRRKMQTADRTQATPETRAKLSPDPLALILAGHDVSLEYAADEIYRVYVAICRAVMSKSPGFGARIPGKGEMSPELAWAHSKTYLPWVAKTGQEITDATLSLIVDRNGWPRPSVAIRVRAALADYARMMRARPEMEDRG